MTPSDPRYVIEPSAGVLADTVAARAVTALTSALEQRPRAHLVLTGGSILEQVMRAIRELGWRDDVDWPRVHVWWADERFVAPDSADRNDRAACAALLDALALDPAHIHRMPSLESGYGDDLEAAARAYSESLAHAADPAADIPAFDLVLLGIGPDGHCASLFPGHPALGRTEAAVDVEDSPKPPPRRISLSFRALDAAREIWLIAGGSGKADAVARAHRAEVPCGRPRGRDRTLWLVDAEAAADLPAYLREHATS